MSDGRPQDSARVTARPSLADVQAAYEAARYLDAHSLTAAEWTRPPATVVDLAADEALLASRLAERLGGRFSAALLRYAGRIAPEHPRVVLHTRFAVEHRSGPYRFIRAFEREPEIEGADAEIQSTWLASHAVTFSLLRDFERAATLIDRAEALHTDWYTFASRAWILLAQHRRADAAIIAERAWDLGGGHPGGASVLSAAFAAIGRGSEAARRIVASIDNGGQSFEVMCVGLAGLLREAHAARSEVRVELAREVLDRATVLERLAPLASGATRRGFASLRVEAARLAEDAEAVILYSEQVDDPFYRSLGDKLRTRGHGAVRVVLPHPHERQRHDTCVPASLATCLGAMGRPIDADAVAAEITYGGTAMWRLAEWAAANDLSARYFRVDWASARALVELAVPFLIAFTGASSGHACAVVGFDEAARTLVAHDPSSGVLEWLVDAGGEAEAPNGPVGCVIFPKDRVDVAALELCDEASTTLAQSIERAMELEGGAAAAALLEAATGERTSATWRLLAAIVAGARGSRATAVDAFVELHREYPKNGRIQARLENAAALARDRERHAEVLRSIVERSDAATRTTSVDLERIPVTFVCRWAAMLRQRAADWPRAESVLLDALRRAPDAAEAYLELGHLLWTKGEREQALLPYRIAAMLAPADERCADAYARALQRVGRAREASEFLAARAIAVDSEAADAGPILSVVDALEQLGDPVAALDTLRRARARRPDHGELAAEAAIVFARFGRDDESAAALRTAHDRARPRDYLRAAALVARLAGRSDDARHFAEAWMEEVPDELAPRSLVLGLTSQREGRAAALARAQSWVAERPRDRGFETLLVEQLEHAGEREQWRERLHGMRARDPTDDWARRELAFDLLGVVRSAAPGDPRIAELEQIVDECRTLDPNAPPTLALDAELALLRGDRATANAMFAECALLYPGYAYAWSRRLELSPGNPAEDLAEVEALLDRIVTRVESSDASVIPRIVARFAELGGHARARAALDRWDLARPDDPHLFEARADLELGVGGRDALAAIATKLDAVVARHPLHEGSRMSAVLLLERLGRTDEACAAALATVADFRERGEQRSFAAGVLARGGRTDDALRLLDEAIALEPSASIFARRKASLLYDAGHATDAIATLDAGAAVNPWCIETLADLTSMLVSLDRGAEAIARLETKSREQPNNAGVLVLLANTLRRTATANSSARAVDVLAKAAAIAPTDWDIALERVALCAERRDAATARQIVDAILPHLEDSVAARGEHAAIAWWSGDRKGAIETLDAIVRERPDYRWGWRTLVHWLRETSATKRALRAIDSMPEAMRHEPEIGMLRVRLLEDAKAKHAEIDDAIEALVLRHPASTAVAELAFDRLVEQRQLERAALVLLHGRPIDSVPASTLARAIRLAVARGQSDEALRIARELWRRTTLAEPDEAEYAVRALAEGGLLGELASRLAAAYRDDEPVDCRIAIATVGDLGVRGLFGELRRMFDVLRGTSSARATSVLARCIESLAECDAEFPILHVQWSRFAADDDVWAAVGYAYARLGHTFQAFEWLGDYREHHDVRMSTVSNYSIAAVECGRLMPANSALRYAAEHVRRDGTWPDVNARLQWTDIAIGATNDFLEHRARYGRLEADRPLEPRLVCFEILHSQDPRGMALAQLCRSYATAKKSCPAPLLDAAWRNTIRERLPWFLRLVAALQPALPVPSLPERTALPPGRG